VDELLGHPFLNPDQQQQQAGGCAPFSQHDDFGLGALKISAGGSDGGDPQGESAAPVWISVPAERGKQKWAA